MTVLDLSGEGMTELSEVELEPNLVELTLMHTRLQAIERLEPLTRLEKLNLRANRIRELRGLECCLQLRELELYENCLTKLGGLDGLSRLEMLDVSFNELTRIEGLEHAGLSSLRQLGANLFFTLRTRTSASVRIVLTAWMRSARHLNVIATRTTSVRREKFPE